MPLKTRRRALVAGTALTTFGILRGPRAQAAEFAIKLGHDDATTQPLHKRAAEAAGQAATPSGGRLAVSIYPNSQLGSDSQMIAQLSSGALEMLMGGYNFRGQVVPTANIPAILFTFVSFQDEWAAMDGPLGKYVHGQLEKIALTPFDTDWEGAQPHA